MKIGPRLILGFSILVVMIIVLIVFSLNSLKKIQNNLNDIVLKDNVRIELANKMLNNTMEVSIQVRGIFLDRSKDSLNRKRDAIKNLRENFNENFKKYIEMVPADHNQIKAQIEIIKNLLDETRTYNDSSVTLLAENKYDEGLALMVKKTRPKIREWVTAMNQLEKTESEILLAHYQEASDSYNRVRYFMITMGSIAFVLSILIAIALTFSIIQPLKIISKLVISRNANMDFKGYESGRGELAFMIQSFSREISEQLRQEKELINLVEEVKETINVLASSSAQILAATTQVASGTAETATAISETSTTVEEVQQASKQSAEKAKNVAESAQRVVQVFQDGKQAVEETISGMNNIRGQMDLIAQTVVRLSEQSQSIGGIIASVTDIADQSNLLAVNAAIEAAKAGEHGKGFSVVAQEIKNLAGQSKQATMQVRNILNDIQKATGAAVMATEKGTKAVEKGLSQSVQAGEAIRILAESSNEAAQAAVQIVASSQQQVIGMDQISVAMQNINQAGTETAVSMSQTEKSAKSLNELGQKLKGLVGTFKG